MKMKTFCEPFTRLQISAPAPVVKHMQTINLKSDKSAATANIPSSPPPLGLQITTAATVASSPAASPPQPPIEQEVSVLIDDLAEATRRCAASALSLRIHVVDHLH